MKKLILVLVVLVSLVGSVFAEDWVNYNFGTEGKSLMIDLDNPYPIETTEELFKTLSTLDCTLTVYDEIVMDDKFVSILKKRKEVFILCQGYQVLGSYWYKDGLVFKLTLDKPM